MPKPKLDPIDFTGHLLADLGVPLTRKHYLNISNYAEGECTPEEESLLPRYAQLDFFKAEDDHDK